MNPAIKHFHFKQIIIWKSKIIMTLIISSQSCRISDWIENYGKMYDVINNQPIRNSMSLLIWNQPIKKQKKRIWNRNHYREMMAWICIHNYTESKIISLTPWHSVIFIKTVFKYLLLCTHFLAVLHPTKQNNISIYMHWYIHIEYICIGTKICACSVRLWS